MALHASELEAWADLLNIPPRALEETDAGLKVRLLRALGKAPRVCIREEHIFHYSDGTTEGARYESNTMGD